MSLIVAVYIITVDHNQINPSFFALSIVVLLILALFFHESQKEYTSTHSTNSSVLYVYYMSLTLLKFGLWCDLKFQPALLKTHFFQDFIDRFYGVQYGHGHVCFSIVVERVKDMFTVNLNILKH